ncbi:MAG: hypothetical protein U9N49_03545 [Campylobacterota bacterium]|nr:hypothetical protein [Campylobacterota bacterium]
MNNKNLEIMGMKVQSFQEAINMAEYFAGTDLVPKDYRGKGANIVVAWQKGLELGLKPLQALSTIAVVNGRATIWGDGLIALVKNSSKEEWTHEVLSGEGDKMIATCETKRLNQEQTIVRSFSVADAKKAGLWGNNVWAKYPKRMLQMRARGLTLRDAYPDVLNGLEIAEEITDLNNQLHDEAVKAPKTLEQLGLSSFERDSYLVVSGNTYGKTETLKKLGFQFKSNEWCKELSQGDLITDIQIEEELKEPEPEKQTPAKALMFFLQEEGIEKARIGVFVKDVLGLTSSDEDGIKKVLSNKDALHQMIQTFLAEPIVEEEKDLFN